MDDGGRPERHPDLIPRLRQIAMVLAFDLGGPLLAYSLLRSAGMSAVAALAISGVLPPWASQSVPWRTGGSTSSG